MEEGEMSNGPPTDDAIPMQDVIEVDASLLMDVVHKYVLDKPKTIIDVAMGSTILCAKSQPDGTIAIWAKRPIDEKAPLCEVGVWTAGTGEPCPQGDFLTYLDTCMVMRPPGVVGGSPMVLVWHVFLDTESLLEGQVSVAR
jgi:hypothetical protein